MSQALRKLTAITNRSGTAVIFINQLREKVGMSYGNPETTTGGRALKFFSSVRLDVRKVEVLKNGTELIGAKTRVRVVKNKVAPPFRESEFDIIYGEGISKEGNILDVAVNLDIIQKSGSWFSYNGQKLGQGRDNVRKYMKENPEFMAEIDAKVRDVLQNSDLSFLSSKSDDDESDAAEDNSQLESAASDIVEVTENDANTSDE
jgi:recombination protein RecA